MPFLTLRNTRLILLKRHHASRRLFSFPSPRHFHPRSISTKPSTGLFAYPAFTTPSSLVQTATQTSHEITKIVSQVVTSHKTNDTLSQRQIVNHLDRLSDLLCFILDSAECIRNIHPDPNWRNAAMEVYTRLSGVLNLLNTNVELYQALKHAVKTREISGKWSEMEERVANLLLADFEKSGISQPHHIRTQFVTLQNRILDLQQKVMNNAHPATSTLTIPKAYDTLAGVSNSTIQSLCPPHSTTANARTTGREAWLILRHARSESIRHEIYKSMHAGSHSQIATLESLLKTRGELAQLLGLPSYAHLTLSDKMAKTPETVTKFLTNLSSQNLPKAQHQISTLTNLKHLHTNTSSPLQIWDRYYYTQFLPSTSRPHQNLSFTPRSILSGLSTLFSHLFGITLIPTTPSPTETWHASITKLHVAHETEGILGTIYCDLLARPHKFEGAAHFTVRCSRRIWEGSFEGPWRSEVNEWVDERGFRWTKPVVVLVTSFGGSAGGRRSRRNAGRKDSVVDDKSDAWEGIDDTTILSYAETETLVHEMGHAMHSMLSRTPYQHISGTRVPTDFVEVPSTLFELLFTHPSTLPYLSTTPSSVLTSTPSHSPPDPIETQHQLHLSLLDQTYHSPSVLSADFNSTTLLTSLQEQYTPFPPTPTIPSQHLFTHLVSYGGTYYSYFWSKSISQQLFEKLFMPYLGGEVGKDVDRLRDSGEVLRREVLGVGGGRDVGVGLRAVGVGVVGGE